MTTKQPTEESGEQTPVSKRLAIVVGDIKGTAALLAQVGDLVVAGALQQFFQRVAHLQTAHHGQLIKTAGDLFVAVFEDVAKALAFAIALQQALSHTPILVGRAGEAPQGAQPLTLRVSLHLGSVVLMKTSYGQDIFGYDVTLSARLVDYAKPGQILVSGPARLALPQEQQALLGPSEYLSGLRGLSGQIEVSRLDVTAQ